MAIDLPKRLVRNARDRGRKKVVSPNPQLKLLNELYEFLARRTDSKFNKTVAKRLKFSKKNKHPLSVGRLSQFMKSNENKVACVISTVTDDIRFDEIQPMTVCALRFTETARRRIEKAGGECLTFDQLAARCPTGEGCILFRGHTKSREAEKHFGRAPGYRGSHTKPYSCPKA